MMILARLRKHTQVIHRRLESHLPVLDPDFALADYRDLLQTFSGFYSPLEEALGAVLVSVPEFSFEARRKVTLLEQDLAFYGVPYDVSQDRLATIPQCSDLPATLLVPQALGCLYVLEGATLGGKIISRHLHSTLGLDAATGAAFYHCYGSDAGHMWRTFGEALTRYANCHSEDPLILLRSAPRGLRCAHGMRVPGASGLAPDRRKGAQRRGRVSLSHRRDC